MTPEMPEVGRRLAAARLRRGLSQGTVARQAGIAPSYLSRLETGRVHPTFRTVVRVARTLRVDLDELVAGPSERFSRGACPVTREGLCVLDLIQAESHARRPGEEAFYPRHVKLLRRLADWMQDASSERLRAIEIVLEEFSQGREERNP
jgi:transcriptional regulator with XRE-family HTH domain